MDDSFVMVDEQRLKELDRILEKYRGGRVRTDTRIKASEEWWKLRNAERESKNTMQGADGGFVSSSGWLHNVIVSKHADAMDAYPEPNILPREAGDRPEAKILSSIIPVILEHNDFEKTYSDVMWQKLKTGTGAYKIVWDSGKLNGLGDIAIERVNLLNLYWEPGVENIQDSKYFFEVSEQDREQLIDAYPQLEGKLKSTVFQPTQFKKDEYDDPATKATVVECYYHRTVNGKKTLQYVKYVGSTVLYSTENDMRVPMKGELDPTTGEMIQLPGMSMAERGLYDHCNYPFVFDTLFPVEGSPCGYGFVDLCKNPQTAIDLLKTAIIKNGMVGALPRYFSNDENNSVNEAEFLDLTNPIVHIKGSMDEYGLRVIDYKPLNGVYLTTADGFINELRETSGNTETATGTTSNGVTAASAIAALQEASGKGSRDATTASYRAFREIVSITIELIRQFYDLPRQFRIVGENGAEDFITYTNTNLQMQSSDEFGLQAARLPVFDIKVETQKRSAYNKLAQNELALQFYQMGFFSPQNVDMALLCLDMMEFDGKDALMQKLSRVGGMFDKLVQYMQLCLEFASMYKPEMVQGIAADIQQTVGALGGQAMSGSNKLMSIGNSMGGIAIGEGTKMQNARANANAASQPSGGKVTARAGASK